MDAAKEELKPAREDQDTALEKLVEALALLVPPQQQPQDQQSQQQQQSQDQNQKDNQEEEQQQTQQAGVDPERLLQALRDREAKRRRDRSRQKRVDYEPVEKDW